MRWLLPAHRYPFCYRNCGLVLTTCLVLVCLTASQLSMRLLLLASQLSSKKTYDDLAKQCFGHTGSRSVNVSISLLNMGALVAYINILADVLSSVAGSIIPPGAEPSRDIMLAGLCCNPELPVSDCYCAHYPHSSACPQEVVESA